MSAKTEFNKEIKLQIKGILFIALAVFCFAGLTYSEQTGHLGIFVNNVLRILAGETALVIPVIVIVFALSIMLPPETLNLKSRLVGIFMLMLIFTVYYHLRFMLNNFDAELLADGFVRSSFKIGYNHEGGGLIGAFFSVILYFLFKDMGSYIVLLTATIISILLIFNITVNQLWLSVKTLLAWIAKGFRSLAYFFIDSYKLLMVGANRDRKNNRKKKLPGIHETAGEQDDNNNTIISKKRTWKNKKNNPREEELAMVDEGELSGNYQQERDIMTGAEQKTGIDNAPEANTPKRSIIVNDGLRYIMPSHDLLTKSKRSNEHAGARQIKDRAILLENTLNSFGVKARVINYQTGPTVTRFEVQPEAGVKVSKILNLADDIALNLAAPVVRIEAPIPGKAALGVEVPNKVISVVHFREVLEDPAFRDNPSPMTMALGKDITGVPVITALDKMPHMLIAGATGSGKSVCLNIIICSLLYKAHPHELKVLMIDPKMVELSIFNGIPHLISPVVTDTKKAAGALKSMIKEMIKRYDLFAREGVRDITSYNEKCATDNIAEPLPYIVVIIDELADLMMVSPAEVEDSIARLAQMARAAGIHLIIATQRPSVDVLTGVIKANVPSRIAFTVSSQVDSRTILDMAGAEKLLGRGDMLFFPVGMVKPLRVQNAFISSKDLKNVVNFVKEQAFEDNAEGELLDDNMEEEEDTTEIDVLLPDAIELVVRTGHGSISLLQRRFRIGYSRAARLIDDLEVRGIVGRHEGSKPREVIISPDQASKLYAEFKGRLSKYE